MDTKELFECIDSLYEEYIDFYREVCEIESPTENKAQVDLCGKYFVNKAEELGLKVEIKPQVGSGDTVIITLNPESTERPVCFSGHIDTVHPIGFFGEHPVTVDLENDLIKGPGVNDCKGGVVGGFMALHALKLMGYKDRPVMLLLQTDEENGSATSNKETIKYICERAKNAIAFLNLESSGGNEITVERKGIIKYNFHVKGIARHASSCFSPKCASAIAEAAHKILEIEKFKDSEGITMSCGLISGGTAINTVPDSCDFSVDVRFLNDNERETAIAALKKIAETSYINGTTCTTNVASFRVSMPYRKANYDLYEKICGIFENCGLEIMGKSRRRGGSDAADVTAAGIPVVDSLGIYGGGGHTIGEYATISSLKLCAKRLCAIAVNIR